MNKRFARWDVATVIDRFTRYKEKLAQECSAHSIIQSVMYAFLTGYDLDLTMGIELIVTGKSSISTHKFQPFYLNAYIALSTNDNLPCTLVRRGNEYQKLESNMDMDYRLRPKPDVDDGLEALEDNGNDELVGSDATIFKDMGAYEYTLYEKKLFPEADTPELLSAKMNNKKKSWWRMSPGHPQYTTHYLQKLPNHFVVSPRGPEFPPYSSLIQHDKNNGVEFDVEQYQDLLKLCQIDQEFGETDEDGPLIPEPTQTDTISENDEESSLPEKTDEKPTNQDPRNLNDHINNFLNVDNPDFMERQKLKFGLMVVAAFFPHCDRLPVIKERLAEQGMTFWDFSKVLVMEAIPEEKKKDSERTVTEDELDKKTENSDSDKNTEHSDSDSDSDNEDFERTVMEDELDKNIENSDSDSDDEIVDKEACEVDLSEDEHTTDKEDNSEEQDEEDELEYSEDDDENSAPSFLNDFAKKVLRNIIAFSPEPDFHKKFTNKKALDEAECKLDFAENTRGQPSEKYTFIDDDDEDDNETTETDEEIARREERITKKMMESVDYIFGPTEGKDTSYGSIFHTNGVNNPIVNKIFASKKLNVSKIFPNTFSTLHRSTLSVSETTKLHRMSPENSDALRIKHDTTSNNDKPVAHKNKRLKQTRKKQEEHDEDSSTSSDDSDVDEPKLPPPELSHNCTISELVEKYKLSPLQACIVRLEATLFLTQKLKLEDYPHPRDKEKQQEALKHNADPLLVTKFVAEIRANPGPRYSITQGRPGAGKTHVIKCVGKFYTSHEAHNETLSCSELGAAASLIDGHTVSRVVGQLRTMGNNKNRQYSLKDTYVFEKTKATFDEMGTLNKPNLCAFSKTTKKATQDSTHFISMNLAMLGDLLQGSGINSIWFDSQKESLDSAEVSKFIKNIEIVHFLIEGRRSKKGNEKLEAIIDATRFGHGTQSDVDLINARHIEKCFKKVSDIPFGIFSNHNDKHRYLFSVMQNLVAQGVCVYVWYGEFTADSQLEYDLQQAILARLYHDLLQHGSGQSNVIVPPINFVFIGCPIELLRNLDTLIAMCNHSTIIVDKITLRDDALPPKLLDSGFYLLDKPPLMIEGELLIDSAIVPNCFKTDGNTRRRILTQETQKSTIKHMWFNGNLFQNLQYEYSNFAYFPCFGSTSASVQGREFKTSILIGNMRKNWTGAPGSSLHVAVSRATRYKKVYFQDTMTLAELRSYKPSSKIVKQLKLLQDKFLIMMEKYFPEVEDIWSESFKETDRFLNFNKTDTKPSGCIFEDDKKIKKKRKQHNSNTDGSTKSKKSKTTHNNTKTSTKSSSKTQTATYNDDSTTTVPPTTNTIYFKFLIANATFDHVLASTSFNRLNNNNAYGTSAWLDDTTVDFFTAYHVAIIPKCASLESVTFTQFSSAPSSRQLTPSITSRSARLLQKFTDNDYIFIPYNHNNTHWTFLFLQKLSGLNFKAYIFDSFGKSQLESKRSVQQKRVSPDLVVAIRTNFPNTFNTICNSNMAITSIIDLNNENRKFQTDSVSCGIFQIQGVITTINYLLQSNGNTLCLDTFPAFFTSEMANFDPASTRKRHAAKILSISSELEYNTPITRGNYGYFEMHHRSSVL
jgi:hypothetical protein